MPALFQKAEKERQQRLAAIQPKRQSQRLQSKQHKEYSENESYTESNDESFSQLDLSKLPLSEQERIKKEHIAKQREERLKQRLLKRESLTNLNENSMNSCASNPINQDENSQASENANESSDFNIRNYFLMHKVMAKLLACKYAWPFKNAVSEDDAPDYNTIIEV